MFAGDISLSSDGSTLVFTSLTDDAALGDTNGEVDVYARDMVADTTELISVKSNGKQFQDPEVTGTEVVAAPSVNGDGTFVAFQVITDAGQTSAESTIWLRNRDTGKTKRLDPGRDPALSGNGGSIAFVTDDPLKSKDANDATDVYIRDLLDRVELRGIVREGARGDGHGRRLAGASVELLKDGETVYGPVSTDQKGEYVFDPIPADTYSVRVTLEDARHEEGRGTLITSVDEPVFDVRHGSGANGPAWVQVLAPALELFNRRNVAFSGREELEESSAIDQGEPAHELDDLAAIFNGLTDYLQWVEENLPGTVLDGGSSPLPVEVHAFSTQIVRMGQVFPMEAFNGEYNAGRTDINLGTEVSQYSYRDGDHDDRGPATEWHEMTHHLWWANLNTICSGDSSHGGYDNPSTCDSMNEGLATFLPTLIRAAPGGGPPPYHLPGTNDFADQYDGFGGVFLESSSLRAWGGVRTIIDGTERIVRREELAVAALLWDLVDDRPDGWVFPLVGADGEHTSYIGPAQELHLEEGVAIPLETLWAVVRAGRTALVRSLWESLYASAAVPATYKEIDIDLDSDGIADVASLDVPFLQHGFYPITPEEFEAPGDTTKFESYLHMHYNVDSGDLLQIPGDARNRAIGFTSHPPSQGSDAVLTRRSLERIPGSSIDVTTTGADGASVPGSYVTISIDDPADPRTLTIPLAEGAGDFYLEPPPYFEGYLTDGDPLPPCDPDAEGHVGIQITAGLGHMEGESHSTDNCSFLSAVATTGEAGAAVDVVLEVPVSPTEVTVGSRTRKDRVIVKGKLSPGYPGGEIVVSYQKRKGRRWRTIQKKVVSLGPLVDSGGGGTFHSSYSTRFARKGGGGKCRLVATWRGTPSHLRSHATRRFKC
jgi:hypothetical protein